MADDIPEGDEFWRPSTGELLVPGASKFWHDAIKSLKPPLLPLVVPAQRATYDSDFVRMPKELGVVHRRILTAFWTTICKHIGPNKTTIRTFRLEFPQRPWGVYAGKRDGEISEDALLEKQQPFFLGGILTVGDGPNGAFFCDLSRKIPAAVISDEIIVTVTLTTSVCYAVLNATWECGVAVRGQLCPPLSQNQNMALAMFGPHMRKNSPGLIVGKHPRREWKHLYGPWFATRGLEDVAILETVREASVIIIIFNTRHREEAIPKPFESYLFAAMLLGSEFQTKFGASAVLECANGQRVMLVYRGVYAIKAIVKNALHQQSRPCRVMPIGNGILCSHVAHDIVMELSRQMTLQT